MGVVVDGVEAINIIKEKHPDLLISGLTLSKPGGMELLKEMKLFSRAFFCYEMTVQILLMEVLENDIFMETLNYQMTHF